MRIATWNLERPKPSDAVRNRARLEKIWEVGADLWILTETHDVIDLSDTHSGVSTAPSHRKPCPGEACATIWSRWPILGRVEAADPSEAVCVEVEHPDGPMLIYGSIIAYARYRGAADGTSAMWEERHHFIGWRGRDRKRLRDEFADRHIITGGDYNQTPDAATWYGTLEGRGRGRPTAPPDASLRCVTEEDFLAAGKRCESRAVDHLGIREALAVRGRDPVRRAAAQ